MTRHRRQAGVSPALPSVSLPAANTRVRIGCRARHRRREPADLSPVLDAAMSIMRGIDGFDPLHSEPIKRVGGAHHEERGIRRSGRLGTGTLACGRCDAPVALAGFAVSPADSISCPFCDHRAPVREFLSLAAPPRPARVEVLVVERASPGVR